MPGEKDCFRRSERRSLGSRWRVDLGVMKALLFTFRRGVAGGVDGEVVEIPFVPVGAEETSKLFRLESEMAEG